MADNRIYLRCAECKRALFLGKRIYSGYYWYNYGKHNNDVTRSTGRNMPLQDERHLEDRLNDFYDKHEWCGDTLDHFEIVYEMDDDFNEKVTFAKEEDES